MEILFIGYYTLFLGVVFWILRFSEGATLGQRSTPVSLGAFVVALVIFSLDAYLRGDRGTDTLGYREHYEWIQDFASVYDLPEGTYQFEAGYNYLVWFCGQFGFDFEIFKFIVGAFSFLALSVIAGHLNVRRSTIFLVTALAGFVFFSYNGVRQWIAMLLFYVAALGLERNKKSIISWGGWCAFLIHKSAIVPMLLSFVFIGATKLRISKWGWVGLVFLFLSVAIIGLRSFDFVSALGYSGYGSNEVLSVSSELGFGWFLQMAINSIALYLLYKNPRGTGFIGLFTVMWAVLYTFFAYNKDIMRLSVYFSFAQVLFFALCLDRNLLRRNLRVLLLLLLFIQYTSLIYFNAGGIVEGKI